MTLGMATMTSMPEPASALRVSWSASNSFAFLMPLSLSSCTTILGDKGCVACVPQFIPSASAVGTPDHDDAAAIATSKTSHGRSAARFAIWFLPRADWNLTRSPPLLNSQQLTGARFIAPGFLVWEPRNWNPTTKASRFTAPKNGKLGIYDWTESRLIRVDGIAKSINWSSDSQKAAPRKPRWRRAKARHETRFPRTRSLWQEHGKEEDSRVNAGNPKSQISKRK
uniref:Uncharacterized protein n=1 Tax=Arundo donax TaxID=35708 RepID=A0A0A9CJ29_ARUDO